MATLAQKIALMEQRMNSMEDKIDTLDAKMDKLMLKLLDPDEGLVIRVNKNTDRLDERDQNMSKWMKDIDDFHQMKRWKSNVTKALWGLYGAAIGYIIKLIFWE